jgi:hypothetical protein
MGESMAQIDNIRIGFDSLLLKIGIAMALSRSLMTWACHMMAAPLASVEVEERVSDAPTYHA